MNFTAMKVASNMVYILQIGYKDTRCPQTLENLENRENDPKKFPAGKSQGIFKKWCHIREKSGNLKIRLKNQ